MTLTDLQLDRYARHIVLREVGGEGQKRLLSAHMAVIGAGGIGSPVIQYLAAAGVGRLTIIDDDVVSLSNLHRQTLFATADVGAPKAERAAAVATGLNPDVDARAVRQRIMPANAAALLDGADIVIDGSDNFATRLAVADACVALRIPLVSASIGQFQGQIGTFRGWEPDQPCYRCFVGDAFDSDDCDSCSELGVLGAIPGIMGSWAAMEAIRHIVDFGPDAAGKLHIFNGITPAMRTVRITKDPACKTCGKPS
ncbi:HesA/MoeB/ThiF family protein [Sphingosinicella humi]|uniref:Molybdopterin-synthase adenylyltransferase n=1 Tax=Allosphingosinicella humi TaxID=2068657 RepID=A0A2U2J4U7_9SPHN|nr:HesA/MoeB/ThiF family protein [Sphingosinicella humi]PWG03332.1 molybdopterin biosynthesis protein MoeB [Sphingosinicella humi]